MGTTLQNGVYLPNEGERNCYAGLKTNWEILDQKVADVTALQQAVAGALHREIVESLPTTDIDPNTIYMILSGTSATENVYNEFMYVNNAWELIGTSATDLTNYYTKGDVDGLLLLKANASDLTSHTGDTTIHVTANDKTKWNTVALIKQLRLVNTQVGSATTIAFANIDDTNGIKVGDKCMDLDGKLFEITAVDTTNETVTVGTALIDLAQDSDVVHKSGDETVGGKKTFTNDVNVNNSNATVQADVPNLTFKNPLVERASTTLDGEQTILFTDKNDNNIASIIAKTYTSGTSDIILTSYSEYNGVKTTGIIIRRTPTTSKFQAYSDNITSLGDTNRRWKSVYAMNYYYGSDNVEFSTKFVTTDTNQTISGAKTFSDNLTIYNSDDTQTPKGLIIRNAQWGMGESGETTVSNISFLDKKFSTPVSIMASKGVSGQSYLRFAVRTKDSQNTTYAEEIYYDIDTSGNVEFRSWHDNTISLGVFAYKWKDVQTYKINNLEPSSLSLPVFPSSSSSIDISAYITDMTGSVANSYTPPANGYITFVATGSQVQIFSDYGLQSKFSIQSGSTIRGYHPVLKNEAIKIYMVGTSIESFRFIPCQGNV